MTKVTTLEDFSIEATILRAERDRDAALFLLTEIPDQDEDQRALVEGMLSEQEAALLVLRRCVSERPKPKTEHQRPAVDLSGPFDPYKGSGGQIAA